MRAFACDSFSLPLPEGHRFPMDKYRRVRESLLADGVLRPDQIGRPPAADDAALALAHDTEYLRRVVDGALDEKEVRRLGFPWSPALVERSRRSVGGTLAACRAALREGVAVNLAGGTHHASRGRAQGYCVFNDAAVAARVLLEEGLERVAVLDADVHQGNGTAEIFADEPRVFTFSIHGARNFPFHKASSDLDIGLPDGTEDRAYLRALEDGVRESLARSRPRLVIYNAGADPYVGDRLGRLALSRDGLRRRDALVLSLCRAAGVPVAVTMGGGYCPEVAEIVAIHVETVRQALRVWQAWRAAEARTGSPA